MVYTVQVKPEPEEPILIDFDDDYCQIIDVKPTRKVKKEVVEDVVDNVETDLLDHLRKPFNQQEPSSSAVVKTEPETSNAFNFLNFREPCQSRNITANLRTRSSDDVNQEQDGPSRPESSSEDEAPAPVSTKELMSELATKLDPKKNGERERERSPRRDGRRVYTIHRRRHSYNNSARYSNRRPVAYRRPQPYRSTHVTRDRSRERRHSDDDRRNYREDRRTYRDDRQSYGDDRPRHRDERPSYRDDRIRRPDSCDEPSAKRFVHRNREPTNWLPTAETQWTNKDKKDDISDDTFYLKNLERQKKAEKEREAITEIESASSNWVDNRIRESQGSPALSDGRDSTNSFGDSKRRELSDIGKTCRYMVTENRQIVPVPSVPCQMRENSESPRFNRRFNDNRNQVSTTFEPRQNCGFNGNIIQARPFVPEPNSFAPPTAPAPARKRQFKTAGGARIARLNFQIWAKVNPEAAAELERKLEANFEESRKNDPEYQRKKAKRDLDKSTKEIELITLD